MASRTERFERKANPKPAVPLQTEEAEIVRFEPEEEAELLRESNERKAAANEKFAAGEYGEAIKIYAEAIATCPNYLYYERAVLNSNVAACHLKLEQWKETVKAASDSVDDLDRLDPTKSKEKENGSKGENAKELKAQEEEADEEIVSAGAAKAENTSDMARRKTDIERIRSKALLRRARARSEMGGWSALGGAEEDYKELSKMPNLSAADRKVVQRQLILLPPRTKAAQEKEMGDMMGQLKQLGNGILKPFGLSTDNFNMVKDEKTGGYSMNFNQGNK
ncbi:hypothetical protein V495_08570 [Pseudogymnoascus sp. VKM F-4514 (FW-929)]|nr:hypothetical protein V495_08570 [Pseudogymnoascus sp. VKM F-4514 (FW-929)]KFY51975.1 hypothetical protein V497_08721 [Pseudogymnoascus sp. VKM F-4516 (FW-969)]